MIKGLILSLQFFTRIPINISVEFSKKNIAYSILFLGIIGAIIGGAGGLIYFFLAPYNKLIASFLALIITIILTGGLHIDGLSDTFDGFMSNRDRKETFEIMKDSTVGAFGVLSIVLLLSFKLILIISIENLPLAMTLSFVNSRMVLGLMLSYKKTAKANGLGSLFHKSKPGKMIILSTIIYLMLLILLDIKYIIPLIVNFMVAEYISHISYKKIGGLTGDVYGSMIEIGDTVSLFSFWSVMIWI